MINIQTYSKQYEALQYLLDDKTSEVLFGAAIFTGKSYISCIYAIYMSLTYPGTRGAMCRSRLTNLIKSTYATFVDLCSTFGISDTVKYNSQTHIITFDNGSQIYLIDLFPQPSDPNFTRFGGYEFTWIIIDEASECSLTAYQLLKTRIRYKLKENNLIGKMFIASNPCTGWLKTMFYDAWRDGLLPDNRKFIQSSPFDNPFADPKVLATYTPENLGTHFYEMLCKGNWDYASSDLDLFNIEDLSNMFYVVSNPGQKYLTCDVAGSGADKTVITIWNGYQCIEIKTFPKTTIPQCVQHIKNAMVVYGIKISNVIVDANGLGQGVADYLSGCKRFVANSSPLKGEKGYINLKTQLFYKFAQMIKDGKIGITSDTLLQNEIIKELQCHRMHNIDKDRAEITPKMMVRQQLGKSPDIADALIMRSYFEFITVSGRLLVSGF